MISTLVTTLVAILVTMEDLWVLAGREGTSFEASNLSHKAHNIKWARCSRPVVGACAVVRSGGRDVLSHGEERF